MPFNLKNNQRRQKRGKTPIPPTKIIRIHGKLKLYIANYNSGDRTWVLTYRFRVRSHYIHFRDKLKYKHLYNMSEADLNKKGYEITSQGIIRKWIKSFEKGPENAPFIKTKYKVSE